MDSKCTRQIRRRAAAIVTIAAAAGIVAGCSTATRTTARGWEFGYPEADSGSMTVPSSRHSSQATSPATRSATTAVPAPAHATNPPANTGHMGAVAQNNTMPNNPHEVAMSLAGGSSQPAAGPFVQPRPLSGPRPTEVGSPYSQFAIATNAAFNPTGGGQSSSDGAPYAQEIFNNRGGPGNMMFDGMEGLSQVTFAADGSVFDPCLSRDGRFIAFASTQHRPTADIYIKPVHGRAVTQLTSDPGHDVMPAISPDGERIAFASNRSGSWDIYVMSSSGGQAARLTSGMTTDLSPSWSPDGRRLVFCRLGQVSGRWEMWVLSLTNPKSEEFIGYGLFPRWCPVAGTGETGADRILFQRSRERGDRAFSLWTIDYRPGDVSSPTEIVSSASAALINPTWSQDGQFIAYVTVPNPETARLNAGRPGSADLWLTSADGSGSVNLTSGNFVNLAPAWGTDGRIYFVSNRGGIENVWSIGTDRAIAAVTGFGVVGAPGLPTELTTHTPAPATTPAPTTTRPDTGGTVYVPTP